MCIYLLGIDFAFRYMNPVEIGLEKVIMIDITVKRRETFNAYAERFSVSPENYLHLFFPDRTYHPHTPLISLKAYFLDKLSRRNEPLNRIVLDVVSEFRGIVQREEISHLVLYGNNRVRVLIDIICCDCMPQSIPVVLSSKEIAKKENIKRQNLPGVPIRPYQIDTDRYPFQNKF
jgi:hypothetical protein